MTQLALSFAQDGAAPARAELRPSIEDRFASFHAANPHVLVTLRRLAMEHVARGASHVGVKWLWEQARVALVVQKLGGFKLDNSLTASYARKLLEVEPSLAPYIELRERRAR